MKVLLTTPAITGKGGVSHYYKAILPTLLDSTNIDLSCIEIGSASNSYKFLHPITDQIKIWNMLKGKNFDLVHVNPSLDPKSLLRDGLILYMAKKRLLPTVIFFHGWDLFCESQINYRFLSLFKNVILNADTIIVLASQFRERLKAWGIDRPIYTETTAIEDELLSEFKIERKLAQLNEIKLVKVLFLSRVEKYKGIFETIDSIKILIERNYSVSLSIAGEGGAVTEVKNHLKKLNLNGNGVTLLGHVNGKDKISILNSHHIYVLPTKHEGMPVSVLEAMAFGMPVVTSPVGGIKDFFLDGKMGFLIEKKDPLMIANLLERLILSKKKLMDIALYNHIYAKKRFLGSIVAERIKDVYFKTIKH